MSNEFGALYNPKGIDIPKLLKWREERLKQLRKEGKREVHLSEFSKYLEEEGAKKEPPPEQAGQSQEPKVETPPASTEQGPEKST